MFSAKTYRDRRKRLKEQLKTGLVLLLGNEEAARSSDVDYRFRQDSTFLYFLGLDFPGLAGVIDIDADKDILIGDEISIDHIVFMGSQPTQKDKGEWVGIQHTASISQLKDLLSQAVSQGRKIHFLPVYRADNKLKLLDWLGLPPATVNEGASVELINAVVEQRSTKTEEEIAEIELAVNISVDMHQAVMQMARPGMLEAELAAEAHRVALAANGDLSFPIILTVNGQVLHNVHHGNQLKKGDLVLCDCGAEAPSHYVGDLTTTLPVDTKFTAQQREVYAIVMAAYDAAVAMLKPGVAFKDVHLRACRIIAEGMTAMGLMKGNLDEAIAEGAHAMFFPCGLGHMMGLDPHDMEELGGRYVGYEGHPKSTQFGLKSLRMARALKPGFVMTVEPGIYFIPELMDLWRSQKKHLAFINYDKLDSFRTFGGLRNEEDYLITETGSRLLGKHKPSTCEEIEALRC
jgi:Xaa-Pro aminopeptidase